MLEGERCENACAMDFDLSPDHELISRTVREFAEGEVAPVAEELDRTKVFPYEIVEKLGEAEPDGNPVSRGVRWRWRRHARICARGRGAHARGLLGRDHALRAHLARNTADLPVRPEAQKREWLPRLCSGERLGAFGLTEPEAGSDAGNVAHARASPDGEWVIDGAKQFITNAGTEHLGDGLHHRRDR